MVYNANMNNKVRMVRGITDQQWRQIKIEAVLHDMTIGQYVEEQLDFALSLKHVSNQAFKELQQEAHIRNQTVGTTLNLILSQRYHPEKKMKLIARPLHQLHIAEQKMS